MCGRVTHTAQRPQRIAVDRSLGKATGGGEIVTPRPPTGIDVPHLMSNTSIMVYEVVSCRLVRWGVRMFERPLSSPIGASPTCSSKRLKAKVFVAAAATGLLMPSWAMAACTDTFNSAFVNAGAPAANPSPAFAYQNLFPLGVGASLNAVVSTMNTVNTAFLSPSSSFVSAKGGAQPGELGGGVWGRAVVGTVETSSTTTSTVDASKAKGNDFNGNTVPLAPITGTGTCKGSIHEDYFGYQFGFDLVKLNIGGNGGNFHFGLTAGFINSNSKDTTAGAHNLRTLGSTNYDFEVSCGKLQRRHAGSVPRSLRCIHAGQLLRRRPGPA